MTIVVGQCAAGTEIGKNPNVDTDEDFLTG